METGRRIDEKDDRKLLYFYKFLFPCVLVMVLGKITNMRVGRCQKRQETGRRIDEKDDRKLLYFYKFLFPCVLVMILGKITNMRVGRLSDIREWKSVLIITSPGAILDVKLLDWSLPARERRIGQKRLSVTRPLLFFRPPPDVSVLLPLPSLSCMLVTDNIVTLGRAMARNTSLASK